MGKSPEQVVAIVQRLSARHAVVLATRVEPAAREALLAAFPHAEAHERARKIKPQYTGGRQVRVAGASNIAEAEMIQGMLLEEGIPSYQRRSRGFDVPDFLAAGPRDIIVPEAGAEAAREVLAQTPIGEQAVAQPPQAASTRPLLLLAAIVGGMAGAFALAWFLYQVTS